MPFLPHIHFIPLLIWSLLVFIPLLIRSLLLLLILGDGDSTCIKLGIDVATLDGRGFLGVDLSRNLTFSFECKLIVLFGLVGGGPAPAIKERRFSVMVLSAVVVQQIRWERKIKEKHNINAVKKQKKQVMLIMVNM